MLCSNIFTTPLRQRGSWQYIFTFQLDNTECRPMGFVDTLPAIFGRKVCLIEGLHCYVAPQSTACSCKEGVAQFLLTICQWIMLKIDGFIVLICTDGSFFRKPTIIVLFDVTKDRRKGQLHLSFDK